VDVKDAGRKRSVAAYADDKGRFTFSDRAATAPVIHAGGRLVMHLSAGTTLKRGGEAQTLFVGIRAPGLGSGACASLSCDSVPADLHPVAEIEFSGAGGKVIRQRLTLDQRC
jgi:hypothetical protein